MERNYLAFENRYILLVLTIILMLSSTPIAGCNQIEIVDEVHTLDLGGIDPPTIEWLIPLNYTEEMVLCWDGAYTGQTEEVWSSMNWANDSDGIDTVIYQYQWENDTEWMNRTPSVTESNFTHGCYSYTFTQSVSWNSQTNYPQIEGGSFRFRIFANDTLGNWRTTPTILYLGGYMVIFTPTTISTNSSQPFSIPEAALLITVFGATIIIVVTVVVVRKSSLGVAQ